ncbi:MAG: vWA domain-containing protein, partial [Pseudomarimonas sp.]
MVNQALFASNGTTTVNAEGAPAYALPPHEALAQLVMTGCLSDTFYANAGSQLDELLVLCAMVEPSFVAKTAVYGRQHGQMKDSPVVLLGWLAVHAPTLAEAIFSQVIDSAAQLRSFVQVMRSGKVGKRSLASRPKRLVQAWLEAASDECLVRGLVGNAPSLGDVIKLAHPRAASVERSALYAHAIGKQVRSDLLPASLQALARFRDDPSQPVPAVPFQMLTHLPLTTAHWMAIAETASWTMTRMNLNTFARHGVFANAEITTRIAQRLSEPEMIRRARAFPYQLLAAYQSASNVPAEIVDALRAATDIATRNVPRIDGSVAVAVDVSGSMQSALTGYRQGATSVMRCVDVAGLVAASVLARNPLAMVLPFAESVRPWSPPREGGVLATAQALARLLGGGTAISAALARLNQLGQAPDVTLIVSDNQSWAEDQWSSGATATARQWDLLRRRNPRAKLICLDLQPYANTQVADRAGVLNIGGFSDAVF